MKTRSRHLGAAMAAAMALGAAGQVVAQQVPTTPPQPANVVALSATATVELAMDWLTVVFNTTREGTDAAAVQSQLRQALDAALTEARKVAKPGEVLVRTGGFALNPRYGQKGGINGWQGQAELIIEGKDTAAIAQTMGRIQTLTIGRVGWSLSREAREKVEAEVTAQAIARFRSRAEAVAKQFGMNGYTVREVSVSGNESNPGMPVPMMRVQAMRGAADESLPVEAGKAQVTATVSGTVQMN
jgi:predicted secreted protein